MEFEEASFLDLFTPNLSAAILKAVDEVQSYADDTIKHFNYLITNRLQGLISHANVNLTVPPSAGGFAEAQRHVLTFLSANLQPPTAPSTEGMARGMRVMQIDAPRMFPHEAMLRDFKAQWVPVIQKAGLQFD